jgi:hypothetical protein
MAKRYVVTIGRADLGEMDEWSRHRKLANARTEAKKMATIGHFRVAANTPQFSAIWNQDDWESDGNRPVNPIEVYEP